MSRRDFVIERDGMDPKLVLTKDGTHTLLSGHFGEHYHSIFGALQESQHVFIDAGLNEKVKKQKDISILELGFGTGLNAFLTLLEARNQSLSVFYTGIEKYPIDLETAQTLNYANHLEAAPSELFLELHQCDWEKRILITPNFDFLKLKKDFLEITDRQRYDLVYFDAFAPNAQPELWETLLLQKMYDALNDSGILVTYCAKGVVKRRLKSVGFSVEAIPGPPGKREMTRATK